MLYIAKKNIRLSNKSIEATGNSLCGFFQRLGAPAPHLGRYIPLGEEKPKSLFNPEVKYLLPQPLNCDLTILRFNLYPDGFTV
jgi:hypothetical protein